MDDQGVQTDPDEDWLAPIACCCGRLADDDAWRTEAHFLLDQTHLLLEEPHRLDRARLERWRRLADAFKRMAKASNAAASDDAATKCVCGANLTIRERQILALITQGRPNKIIAHTFGISIRTVENHRLRIMRKTKSNNLVSLIVKLQNHKTSIEKYEERIGS